MSKIRATPFGAPFLLHSAKWEMHLKLGQSGLGRARDASALFEMELTHAGATKVGVCVCVCGLSLACALL